MIRKSGPRFSDKIMLKRKKRAARDPASTNKTLLLRRCLARPRDRIPGFQVLVRFPHRGQELLLGVVMLPAAGAVEFDDMVAASLRKIAPFLCELVVRAVELPVRHRKAIKKPSDSACFDGHGFMQASQAFSE